ncbi:MAG TPA: ATP-binding protein, partial [Patescibacteria group bacterium]|nr:ATP-binding protein [Patescibacteria group bacterium]
MNGDRAVGALQLMSGEPEGLDDLDLQTVQMIAGFAGAAFERAATTARLQAGERRTRAVIESSPDPIVIMNTDSGAIVEFNPAAEAAFGRPRAEAIGLPATALVSPKYVTAFHRWLGGGATAGTAEYAGRHFHTVGLRANGEEFPIEAAIADLREETRLAAAFIRDLSLLDKLQESRDRLAAVIAEAPVILLACDRQGILTLSDGKGLASIGIHENIVGRDLRELLGSEPDGLWHLERARAGASYSGQIHLTSSKSSPEGVQDIYLQGSYGPLRDSTGEFIGVSMILTNVTDRVRAESAQRESDAKSRLMAIMNHEVRTPLNSILGFAHLLKEPRIGELNDQQRRYVNNIEQAGNGLLDLINDSLDLARLKSGQPAVKPERVAVSSLLDGVADQVKPEATAHGLRIAVEHPGELAVLADQRLLNQVLLNLLSNAIRHTPPGGTVTLSAARGADSIAIEVRDTGRGIAKEDLERVFDEFYQAPNHASGGTGLGLTISRRLVQLMNGSIVADSEV